MRFARRRSGPGQGGGGVFGLSWDRIFLILIVLVFVVGPERIPTAINWLMSSLRKVRTMAAGAQAELRTQIGPELDELRRQVAELQSLKEVQELKALRDLNPRTIIGKNILGDEFSGGIAGFLGLNDPSTKPANGAADANGAGNGSVNAANGQPVGHPEAAGNGSLSTAAPAAVRALAPGEAPPIDLDAT
jgi:sec-independent protein translocase protein TatB